MRGCPTLLLDATKCRSSMRIAWACPLALDWQGCVAVRPLQHSVNPVAWSCSRSSLSFTYARRSEASSTWSSWSSSSCNAAAVAEQPRFSRFVLFFARAVVGVAGPASIAAIESSALCAATLLFCFAAINSVNYGFTLSSRRTRCAPPYSSLRRTCLRRARGFTCLASLAGTASCLLVIVPHELHSRASSFLTRP